MIWRETSTPSTVTSVNANINKSVRKKLDESSGLATVCVPLRFILPWTVACGRRDLYLGQYVNGIPSGAEGKRIPCRRILARRHLPGWVEHAITCEDLETKIQEQEALLRRAQRECLNELRADV